MNARILLVEDDENLRRSLASYLSQHGFQLTLASTLLEARERVRSKPDAIILDWMLPDGEGIDLLQELRKQHNLTPIILLTARADLVDKVVGLESGANDYLSKPFEPRELVARIRVQLRQQGQEQSPDSSRIICGPIEILPEEHEARFEGKTLELTKMEYELLKLLAAHPQRAFSREELLNKVWGFERFPTTRTVDTHVLMLRQKTRDDLIETIRGVGYRLNTPKTTEA